jgi:hypothetical protein
MMALTEKGHGIACGQDSQPGTLLWVGPTAHPEFVDAFRYCRSSVAQIAVRRNESEAIRRPAGFVRRIIFARPTRRPLRRAVCEAFQALYRDARGLAIGGSLCDGELRTGSAWPLGDSIRFSRWSQALPKWLTPCRTPCPAETSGKSTELTLAGKSLLVVADRFEMAEPWLGLAESLFAHCAWHRRYVAVLHHRFDTILWDDSASPPAATDGWRQRLGGQGTDARYPASGGNVRQRHLWMAFQPSVESAAAATAGGVSVVLTKPVLVDHFLTVAVS